MDIFAFVASLFDSLAWPIAVLTSVILLRRPLSTLISGTRGLRYKGLEIDFSEQLEDIAAKAGGVEELSEIPPPSVDVEAPPEAPQDRIERIAEVSPGAAIVEKWHEVERLVDWYYTNQAIERPRNPRRVFHDLNIDPDFQEDMTVIYESLRQLRNEAAHGALDITLQDAESFSKLANMVMNALRRATMVK